MKRLTAILLALAIVFTLLPMAVMADDPPETEQDETTIIPLDGDCEHASLTHHDAVDADCTTAGTIEYWSCSDCQKNFSDAACTTEVTDITVPALGHDLSYTADGAVITETCSRCDHTATATISASDAEHTGSAIENASVVYSEDWLGGALEITYANNVDVGTATASITIGTATASVTFAINAAGIPGDINGDGAVNTKDITTLRRYLAGGYGISVADAIGDVNHDGSINTKDITTLRRYLAGGYGITL